MLSLVPSCPIGLSVNGLRSPSPPICASPGSTRANTLVRKLHKPLSYLAQQKVVSVSNAPNHNYMNVQLPSP